MMGMGFMAHAQMTEVEIQAMYMEYLDSEGIESFIDSDGDVRFEYNNHNYFLEVNEEDQEFFRVVLFNMWAIESEEERVRAHAACNTVCRDLKVVKAYILNDNTWMACELYLKDPSDFSEVFFRCVRTIEDGVDAFVAEM